MKKQTKIMIGMGIVIILTLGYIIYNYQSEKRIEKNFIIYQDGQINALVTIYQASEQCQIVPLQIGNLTRSLVDINCLKQEDE